MGNSSKKEIFYSSTGDEFQKDIIPKILPDAVVNIIFRYWDPLTQSEVNQFIKDNRLNSKNKASISLEFIKNRQAQIFANWLSQNPNTKLSTICLPNHNMGESGIRAIADSLKTYTTVNKIEIDGVSIPLREKQVHMYMSGGPHSDCNAIIIAAIVMTNPRLTMLDLSDNKIGEVGACAISENLKTNSFLTCLILGKKEKGNLIGDKGAIYIGKSLESNCGLKDLQLTSNKIGINGAEALAEGLKSNSTLTSFDIRQNCNINANADTPFIKLIHENAIIRSFNGINTYKLKNNLGKKKIIDLSSFKCTSTEVILLGFWLESNNKVKEINLSHGTFNLSDAIQFISCLKMNTTLIVLSLFDAQNRDGIALYTRKQRIETEWLQTSWQNYRLPINWKFDFSALGRKIDLKGKNIISTEFATLIYYIKTHATVKEVILSENSMGEKGVKFLGDVLERNKSITKLDISSNQLGDVGASSIGNCLLKNGGLQILNLSANNIGLLGAQSIGQGLIKHKSLSELNLSNNCLSDDGIIHIFQALQTNTVLITISLAENKITDKGAQVIADFLSKNKSLKNLILTSNDIGDTGAIAIGTSILYNTTLVKLYFAYNKYSRETEIQLKSDCRDHASILLTWFGGIKKKKVTKAGTKILN